MRNLDVRGIDQGFQSGAGVFVLVYDSPIVEFLLAPGLMIARAPVSEYDGCWEFRSVYKTENLRVYRWQFVDLETHMNCRKSLGLEDVLVDKTSNTIAIADLTRGSGLEGSVNIVLPKRSRPCWAQYVLSSFGPL